MNTFWERSIIQRSVVLELVGKRKRKKGEKGRSDLIKLPSSTRISDLSSKVNVPLDTSTLVSWLNLSTPLREGS